MGLGKRAQLSANEQYNDEYDELFPLSLSSSIVRIAGKDAAARIFLCPKPQLSELSKYVCFIWKTHYHLFLSRTFCLH